MISLDCPECQNDEALRFTVEYDTDQGVYRAELERQDCDCELTDTQLESLRDDAAERYVEPDED